MRKSFIEADFPIKGVSEESAKEKNIRHGHISTLHIWWARNLWLLQEQQYTLPLHLSQRMKRKE